VAFQAGYTTNNNGWAHTQFRLGVELFYEDIALGLDYINRKNMQKNAGYSLDGLMLFVRFRGKSDLL
jgi:predicted porin